MAVKKRQLAIVFDTEENYAVDTRILNGLAASRGISKSALVQNSLEKCTRPHDPQLNNLSIEYVNGALSDLSVIASFFRRAGEDVERGMPRCNCGAILDATRSYLLNYLDRKPRELEDGLRVAEKISLLSHEWHAREYTAASFFEVAELLEAQDSMPLLSRARESSRRDGSFFEIVLMMDTAASEWSDPRQMDKYGKDSLSLSMNHGKDTLVIPHAGSYRILNPLDAPSSSCAAVVSVRNKGSLDIPFFVIFANEPPSDFSAEQKSAFNEAMASVCPGYARALEMKVEPRFEGGECINAEEHIHSPYPGFFHVNDSDDEILLAGSNVTSFDFPFIIRGNHSE